MFFVHQATIIHINVLSRIYLFCVKVARKLRFPNASQSRWLDKRSNTIHHHLSILTYLRPAIYTEMKTRSDIYRRHWRTHYTEQGVETWEQKDWCQAQCDSLYPAVSYLTSYVNPQRLKTTTRSRGIVSIRLVTEVHINARRHTREVLKMNTNYIDPTTVTSRQT